MRHRKKTISTSQHGNVALEFAMLAPVLFLLMMAIIEFGLILVVNIALEGATNIGSRLGKTGYTENNLTREAYIRQEITRFSGGFIKPANLVIEVLSYSDFDKIGQPEPCITPSPCSGQPGVNFTDVNGNGRWDQDMGAASAGGGGQVALYRVRYPWRVATPGLATVLGAQNGIYTITSVATVRNEPF